MPLDFTLQQETLFPLRTFTLARFTQGYEELGSIACSSDAPDTTRHSQILPVLALLPLWHLDAIIASNVLHCPVLTLLNESTSRSFLILYVTSSTFKILEFDPDDWLSLVHAPIS